MNLKSASFSSSINQLQLIFLIVCVLLNCLANAQRGSYAGSRTQNGYKDKLRPSTGAPQEDIVSRFGDDPNRIQRPPISSSSVIQPAQNYVPISQQQQNNQIPDLSNRNTIQQFESATSRLPYDALGDRELVERLNRLPIDQRPFWLVNAAAIEAHRNRTGSQLNGFNAIAERGSFAGSSSLGSLGNTEFQQQSQSRPQEQAILNRIDIPSASVSRSQAGPVSNRRTFDRTSGNNVVGLNSRGDFQQPINRVADSVNREVDSQGGRFVYVGQQLYEELKKANLVV